MKNTLSLIFLVSLGLNLSCKTTQNKPNRTLANLVDEPSFLKRNSAVVSKETCSVDESVGLISEKDLDLMLGLEDEKRFGTGKKYYFSFNDTSLQAALKELSTESKLPITVDENVSGVVNLDIKGESFLGALKMLLASGSYDYKFNGAYFYIGSTDPKEKSLQKLSHSYRYKLNHIKPSMVEKLMHSSYKDAIKVDDSLGVVSIVANRNSMKQIIQIISGLDKPARQILLKLSIAEISGRNSEGFGRYLGSMGSSFGVLNSLAPVQPAFQSAVLSKSAYIDFLSSFTILNQQGYAEIKAQPKILVQDGEKAEFNSVKKTLLRSDSKALVSKLSFIETGIGLTLQPFIVENDEISLLVLNAKSGDLDIAENPQVTEHEIKTKVRVKPGETLVLGGMISKKNKVITKKIPFLGDLPYLGWLFKSESSFEDDVEVVFTITPEILCN